MALTREFRETVYKRAQRDGAFRKALPFSKCCRREPASS